VGAAGPGDGQRLLAVRQVVVGLPAERPEERNGLARAAQGPPDGLRFEERLERLEVGPARNGTHLLQQERPNTVEFQCSK
jgi:hypothetical protein